MNKISTLGYFKKRLRDSGFITNDLFKNYNKSDKRKWSVIINPGADSIIITCYNSPDFSAPIFEFFDDGSKIKSKHISISTISMEVIIEKLIYWGISNQNTSSSYFKSSNPGIN